MYTVTYVHLYSSMLKTMGPYGYVWFQTLIVNSSFLPFHSNSETPGFHYLPFTCFLSSSRCTHLSLLRLLPAPPCGYFPHSFRFWQAADFFPPPECSCIAPVTLLYGCLFHPVQLWQCQATFHPGVFFTSFELWSQPFSMDTILKLWDPVLGASHSWNPSLSYLGSDCACGAVPWAPLPCAPSSSSSDSDSYARPVSALVSNTPCLAILLLSFSLSIMLCTIWWCSC